jgi:hypothetical protein
MRITLLYGVYNFDLSLMGKKPERSYKPTPKKHEKKIAQCIELKMLKTVI